ncbi:MAG: 2-dehydro-3-deoxyphosphooctonate aldolase [Crocinitomicaceae bacterium]|nr:2-dehydro-3-deoxyphosphooctonate aldolase [Crocinitomicaceae bacterium]
MRYTLTLLLVLIILASCGTAKVLPSGPIKITKVTKDATYGSEKNPILVGGVVDSKGPQNEGAYLDLLAGPNGEEISYKRVKSCCSFKSDRGFMGKGLLDVYEVKYEGLRKPVLLYINMYDYQTLYAPIGFTIR